MKSKHIIIDLIGLFFFLTGFCLIMINAKCIYASVISVLFGILIFELNNKITYK
jgi:TRAP-type mannitol/chloroaromatic compound transport system permease small subunit